MATGDAWCNAAGNTTKEFPSVWNKGSLTGGVLAAYCNAAITQEITLGFGLER
jgi:hypothetical protein